jgi:pre-rRNA-processing protein TSR2
MHGGQQQQQSTGFMLLQQHNAAPVRCNEEQFKGFVAGIEAVLSQWTALLLVTHHRDGEALKIIRDEIVNWFWEDGEVYSDELEQYFDDFFESVRYVMVEDGSSKEVSDVMHSMYVTCAKNDFSMIHHYQQMLVVFQQANPVQQSVFGGNWAMDEAGQQVNVDAEDEDDEAEQTEGTSAGVEDEESVVAEVAPAAVADAARPKPQGNKKNPFKKGNDGWCTIERKR